MNRLSDGLRMFAVVVVAMPIAAWSYSGSSSSADDGARVPIRADLRIECAAIKLGRRVTVKARITNSSNRPITVYDATLDPLLIPKAAVLALLDSEGNYVADMLRRDRGSCVFPHPSNWRHILPGESVSAVAEFTAGRAAGVDLKAGQELPAGKYSLELRLYERVLSEPPFKNTAGARRSDYEDIEKMENWFAGFPGQEICRSNRVELEILPRTGD